MPTPTYVPLATIDATSASIVTFSSIPATYRDLVVVINGQPSSFPISVYLQFNNDTTAANYPQIYAYGDGSATGSTSLTSAGMHAMYNPSGTKVTSINNIMDYSATDKHKTALHRSNGDWVIMWAGRWANTSAISEIDIVFAQGGVTWTSGSLISLYGIA